MGCVHFKVVRKVSRRGESDHAVADCRDPVSTVTKT